MVYYKPWNYNSAQLFEQKYSQKLSMKFTLNITCIVY